jgi:hypothetical protein
MKKVLLSAFAGLFVIGATTAFSNRAGTTLSFRQLKTDTVPKDTTRPDTSKAALISYTYANRMQLDTVPKDTTRPDTSRIALINTYASRR